MIVSLEGEEATWKTGLMYTAPFPIVSCNFDMGWERSMAGVRYREYEGLRRKVYHYQPGMVPDKSMWADTDITIFEMPSPIQLDSQVVKGCIELYGFFVAVYANALMDPKVKTVGVDTMTICRRIKVDAYLQGMQQQWLKAHPQQAEQGIYTYSYTNSDGRTVWDNMRVQLLQIEYGRPNDDIRDLYTMAAGLGKNLVATHHLTDERIKNELTGRRVLEGLNQTYKYVDVALRMEKRNTDKGVELSAKWMKCGYNLGLEGGVLPNPTWNTIVDTVTMSLGGRIDLPLRDTLPTPLSASGSP